MLSGLTRVRQFSQDDAHCFVMESQIAEEVERLLRLVQRVYGDFGLTSRDEAVDAAAESSWATIATWDHAEASAEAGARRGRASRTRSTRATARSTGRRSTSTSPTRSAGSGSAPRFSSTTSCRERFDLKYVGADNAEHRPVVIHRAIFGSFERFLALLIEHFAGAWPLWLAPVQVVVLPIADRHLDYAAERAGPARPRPGCGSKLDERVEKIGYKIREAQLQKVPYMLVIGDREAAEGTVSVRSRSAATLGRGRWPSSSATRVGRSRTARRSDATAAAVEKQT